MVTVDGDHELMLWFIERIFSVVKYTVIKADSAGEALTLAMQPTIDMVSLSILTLKKDRFGFLREIRAAARNTPVIVMTVGDVNYLEFAKQLGVVDSLAKPIDEQKLIVPIQNVV